MATTALHPLLEDLYANPDDWGLRSIVADWYEDSGRLKEAEALRWMVSNKKRPYHTMSNRNDAAWFGPMFPGHGVDPESDIPEELSVHLRNGQGSPGEYRYNGTKQAEEAFVAAWIEWDSKGRP